MAALRAFSAPEAGRAKKLLAARVALMMGRKLEEGDWTSVYCRAKGIPEARWSNLHIDVCHGGLGVEMKLLRIARPGGGSIKSVCGTTLMHPAATRSVRIRDYAAPPDRVMQEVLLQYAELIQGRAAKVRAEASGADPDMRVGWLMWEDGLTEFLYFEEPMAPPDWRDYFAEWNDTPARGARKASRSLWIYEKGTRRKRYSVTTSAGIKIQPYFDVPPPSDANLYYFRVQGEVVGPDTVILWVTGPTAHALERCVGSLERGRVSAAILGAFGRVGASAPFADPGGDLAVPIRVTAAAYSRLLEGCDAVSDEHRAQLLLRALG